MQHLDEGTIHAWLDGELPPAEQEAAEAHVPACAQCRAAVAEARGFIAASSRILTALDSVPGGVLPVKDSVVTSTGARKRFTVSRAWMAAAAVLVLGTVTVIARRPGQDDKLANAVFQKKPQSVHGEELQLQAPAAVAAAPAAAPATPVPRATTPMNAPAQAPRAVGGGSPAGFADKNDVRAEVARKDAREKKEANPSPSRDLADAASPASGLTAKPAMAAAPTPAADSALASASASTRRVDSLQTRGATLGSIVITGEGTTTMNEKLGRVLADSSAADSVAPQIVSRSTSSYAGDTVVTTIYDVRGVTVSFIDRSGTRGETRHLQVRGLTSQTVAKVRDEAAQINSITWSDSSGHTRTLRGAVSREELERIRTALFGPKP
jgi:hypothetical protein